MFLGTPEKGIDKRLILEEDRDADYLFITLEANLHPAPEKPSFVPDEAFIRPWRKFHLPLVKVSFDREEAFSKGE